MSNFINHLVIRPVREHDLPFLIWSEEEKEFVDFHRENFEKAERKEILFLVAEVDGEAAGRVRILPTTQYGAGWIFGLQVKPTMRNKGIGTQLIKRAEEIIWLSNQSLVYLSVEVQNTDALRLYERLGYRIFHKALQTWTYPKDGARVEVTDELYYMEKRLA